MTLQEIHSVLHTTAALRMPRLVPAMAPAERVERLEDYLNLTAVARGDLHEARMHASAATQALVGEWELIEGWEAHLRRRRADPSEREVKLAKREIRPDLHDGIRDGRWLLEELAQQIHRLELDDRAASRLYTLITGG